jgi:hypothetical protein
MVDSYLRRSVSKVITCYDDDSVLQELLSVFQKAAASNSDGE